MTAEVGALQIRLDTDLSTITAKFDTAGRVVDRFGKNTERRIGALGGVFNKLGTVATGALAGFAGGLAGGIALGALQEIPQVLRKIVADGAGLVDTANKVGLTTESLQELHFAATQGGASIEDFDKAMGVFAKGLGEASAGGGELGKVLKANGIALRDQAGNLRPVKDLLKDYADLIKNAGSEQERARIVAIAFGRAGADLANVFRDGASGVDDAAAAASRLGLVIDDAMLQKIADLDDRWDQFSTTLETRTKSAVLSAVTWMDSLGGSIQAIGKQLSQFEKERAGTALSPGAMIGDMAGKPSDRLSGPKSGATAELAASLSEGKPTSWAGRDAWLGVTKPTVLPPVPQTATRDREAERAAREQAAIVKLIDSLKEENDLVGASDTKRAVSNNLREAGASATAKQRKQIEDLTVSLVKNQVAYEASQATIAALKDTSRDVIGGLADDLRSGVSAADALGNAFDKLADRLISSGLDAALDAVFGKPGTGGSDSGAPSIISGLLSTITGHAVGGAIRGAGTGTSDSILAKVSNGEFLVKAAQARKYAGLLTAINADALPAFARGGFVRQSVEPSYADGGFVAPQIPSMSDFPGLQGATQHMVSGGDTFDLRSTINLQGGGAPAGIEARLNAALDARDKAIVAKLPGIIMQHRTDRRI